MRLYQVTHSIVQLGGTWAFFLTSTGGWPFFLSQYGSQVCLSYPVGELLQVCLYYPVRELDIFLIQSESQVCLSYPVREIGFSLLSSLRVRSVLLIQSESWAFLSYPVREIGLVTALVTISFIVLVLVLFLNSALVHPSVTFLGPAFSQTLLWSLGLSFFIDLVLFRTLRLLLSLFFYLPCDCS